MADDITAAERIDEILTSIERAYPGRLVLSLAETCALLGLSRQTAYNATSRKGTGRFPVKPVRVNGRPRFRVHDIARHIAEL